MNGGARSDVARILAEIANEYEAGRAALYGTAAVASHAAITARMERIEVGRRELAARIGNGDYAMTLIVAALEGD